MPVLIFVSVAVVTIYLFFGPLDNVINIVIDDIIRHHEWSPEEHKLADLRIFNCERCGEEDDRFPDKGDLKLLCKKCS